MRTLAAVAPLLVLAACTSTVSGSPAPAPTSTAPTSTAPAAVAGVTVGGGCDLLEPAQVEEITGRSGVTETPSGLNNTSDFQGCFYDDDTPQIFLTASYARGFEGADGQRRVEQTAAALGGGPTDPVPDLGVGAVHSPGTDGQAFVLFALPDAERGGLVVLTVRGELPREQLEALARQVEANL